MKLGMPTLVEFSDIEDNYLLCSKLGLDFVELNMNLPECNPESLKYKDILEHKRKYNIDFAIHLPEELDLSSIHSPIRRGHLHRCKEAIDWANRSEIKIINMHLNQGVYFTLPDRKVWIYEKHDKLFQENLLDSYSELYEYASSRGVRLCIENTCNFQLHFVKEALLQLSTFDDFSLTWDTGHDAKAGFMEEPILQDHQNRIHHMHLHDYNGKRDHQTLYTGCVPVNSRLEFAKERGISVVVEVKTADALEESIKNIRNLWK